MNRYLLSPFYLLYRKIAQHLFFLPFYEFDWSFIFIYLFDQSLPIIFSWVRYSHHQCLFLAKYFYLSAKIVARLDTVSSLLRHLTRTEPRREAGDRSAAGADTTGSVLAGNLRAGRGPATRRHRRQLIRGDTEGPCRGRGGNVDETNCDKWYSG